jgi:hypothetical protein
MLKILLISIILVAIAFAGLGIRMLLDRNAEFSGGSCQAQADKPGERGIACGCVGHCMTKQADMDPSR